MSGNPDGTISIDEAAESLMVAEPETAPQDADDVTDEVETEEVETEEAEAQEGETDDADDTDADADDEEDEDTDDADEEEGEDDPTFEVMTVNGKETLPVSELAAGYMRTADYTKKTMAAAEQVKQAEAVKAQVSQQQSQLEEALAYWAVPVEQEPDWAAVSREREPSEVFALQQQWNQRVQRKQQAAEYHQQLRAQIHQERVAAEQDRLFELFPEWRDPQKFKAGAEKMLVGGENYGFSQQEMADMVDSRMFKVLDDALKYRELKAAEPKVAKKVSKAPAKLRTGSKPNKAEASKAARQKQLDRFKKTGSIDDAVDILLMGD
jgi:hypothetical protein